MIIPCRSRDHLRQEQDGHAVGAVHDDMMWHTPPLPSIFPELDDALAGYKLQIGPSPTLAAEFHSYSSVRPEDEEDELIIELDIHSNRRKRSSRGKELTFQHREIHNHIERARREELKDLLLELKSSIPLLAVRERVSKISILKAAKSYIASLLSMEERMTREIEAERRRNAALIQHFRYLKEGPLEFSL